LTTTGEAGFRRSETAKAEETSGPSDREEAGMLVRRGTVEEAATEETELSATVDSRTNVSSIGNDDKGEETNASESAGRRTGVDAIGGGDAELATEPLFDERTTERSAKEDESEEEERDEPSGQDESSNESIDARITRKQARISVIDERTRADGPRGEGKTQKELDRMQDTQREESAERLQGK
jgi:hypothetical protein